MTLSSGSRLGPYEVLELYLNPAKDAVVISFDEKTQVQALDRTQPMLPMKPGQVERRTHDYRRNGVVDLFAALELATGRVVGDCRDSRNSRDFLAFLKRLNRTFTPQPRDLARCRLGLSSG